MGCLIGKNQVHVVSDAKRKGDLDSESLKSHDRNGSATSKTSRRSGDSGFDDDEAQLIHRDILSRPGKNDLERQAETSILATLHEEGLIQRPIASRAFAVSFEVFAADSEIPGVLKKPPPRLAKLEKRKKKKKVLTEEQIREKLRKAEERRKEHEQLRLAKIQSLQKTDIQYAMEKVAQNQKEVEESSKTKEEIAAENREKKLKEKLEKLRLKKEHAAEVRRRKAAAAAAATPTTADASDSTAARVSESTKEPNSLSNKYTQAIQPRQPIRVASAPASATATHA